MTYESPGETWETGKTLNSKVNPLCQRQADVGTYHVENELPNFPISLLCQTERQTQDNLPP